MCRAYGAYAGLQPGAYKRRSTRTRWRGKLAATGVKPSSDEAGGMMQKHEYRRIGWAVAAAFVLAASAATLGSVAAQNENKALSQHAEKTQTKVVLLGTGTPRPFPDRSGPATAIVVGQRAYLVDFGPGVVRRASAAAAQGTPQLESTNLKIAFLTHLHSDHTTGYPDLILTPWVMGRMELDVFGPEGFGYRFDTPGKSIVISGDTSPSEEIVAHCQPCDVLIHEVYSPESVLGMPDYKTYRAKYHTSTSALAEIANRAKPGILVVYHTSGKGPNGPIPDEQLLREIQKTYHGKVVIGHDLEVY